MSEQYMNQAGGPPEGGFQPSPDFIQRIQRVEMAKALVEPDRVPFMPSMNNFYVYHYNKTTVKEWMEDCHSIIPSMDQYLKDYNPDLVWTPGMFPKNAMEIIGSNQCRWPGEYWNLPDNTAYQYVDKSFLGDDDWDEFFKYARLMNEQNTIELEKWDFFKTPYSPLSGIAESLYRLYSWQSVNGQEEYFNKVDRKVIQIMRKCYENKYLPFGGRTRHRAFLWGPSAVYYTDFPPWDIT